MKKVLFPYILFSIVYGLVFINYIDISNTLSINHVNGYHLWLTMMYFLPFSILTIYKLRRNWKLMVGLGLISSLMNDIFYGLIFQLFSSNLSLSWYYSNWLYPQSTQLFNLDLGLVLIPVYSWSMAISIYLRIVVIYILLRKYRR